MTGKRTAGTVPTSKVAHRQSACARPLSKGTVPLFALLLTSCGFHLQGRQPLPPQFAYTYVDTRDEQTDFVQDLRKALIASKVNVIRTQGSAGATVTVHEDELVERILSVSARNIPTEYELTYRVTFSVISEGKTLIEKEEISATRDISFDEAQLLAKEREQEILRAALARDLVGLVMRRLAAL
jgi:LPS-assembly lipoprotein